MLTVRRWGPQQLRDTDSVDLTFDSDAAPICWQPSDRLLQLPTFLQQDSGLCSTVSDTLLMQCRKLGNDQTLDLHALSSTLR